MSEGFETCPVGTMERLKRLEAENRRLSEIERVWLADWDIWVKHQDWVEETETVIANLSELLRRVNNE